MGSKALSNNNRERKAIGLYAGLFGGALLECSFGRKLRN